MPFAFLAPLFLAGLLAIAIPVIVHLTHKEKQEVQRFPSLMFVRQIPYRSTQKQRIRHWFLLLMRIMALLLIAAAFARPFMERPTPPAPAGTGARELVILLDRSYSMGYQGRWAVAARAASDALDGVESGERATLVLFDERADAVRAQEGDLLPLRQALKDARPGSLGTRYAPPLRFVQSVLQSSQLPRREVILITDLQRSGWNAREPIDLPRGTEFRVVDVGRDSAANIAVAGLSFARANFAGRERVTLTARVLNRSSKAETLPVTLELDGRPAERKALTIPANQAGTVAFPEFTLAANVRGTITAGSDALDADNHYYFVLAPGQASVVSIIRPGGGGDESLYLERALSASGDPAFQVGLHAQVLPDNVLRTGSVVILNDVAPTASDAKKLQRFVEGGGGLLVVLGGRSGGWRGEAADLLPGTLGGTIEREIAAPGRIASIQYGHRVFESFRAARAGDFTSARMYRYRALDVGDPSAVLARFDDGHAAVAERKIGAGRVLVIAAPLDNLWSDLPLQPVFAPFIRELASYLAGGNSGSAWRTAGEVVDAASLFTAANTTGRRDLVIAAPSGQRSTLNATAGGLLSLSEQGFYQVRAPGQNSSLPIAVNLDLAESDLSRVPEAELRAAIISSAASNTAVADSEVTPLEHERKQSLWWYLLLGAVLLLVAESFISNRLSRVARA